MLSIKQKLKQNTADLYPAYFALVMSTGIVSLATSIFNYSGIARILLYLNIVFYSSLWLLLLMRVYFHAKLVLNDLGNHKTGAGFLTLIAGTCILGTQFIIMFPNNPIALWLYFLGVALWLPLIYTFFSSIIIKQQKPSIEHGIDGSWLLIVVAIESISILGTRLWHNNIVTGRTLELFNLSMFALGCIFYILLITLILYRLIFFRLKAEDYVPNYWINMGAVAIITLAGAELILTHSGLGITVDFIPFIKGMILMFWILGTWWIPLILILGIRQHICLKVPLTYHPQYWSLVFPLGMYTVCTFELGSILHSSAQIQLSTIFLFIALTAWFITVTGLLRRIYSTLISRQLK